MKKIVITIIDSNSNNDKTAYRIPEIPALETKIETEFPVNSVLQKLLEPGDDLRVIRIVNKDSSDAAERQKEEMVRILDGGVRLEVFDLNPKSLNSEGLESLFREIVALFEDRAQVFVDMSNGPAVLMPVLLYALAFGEKFFEADIRNIFSASGDTLNDLTPLFYLNEFTSVMEAPDSSTAIERLDRFLSI